MMRGGNASGSGLHMSSSMPPSNNLSFMNQDENIEGFNEQWQNIQQSPDHFYNFRKNSRAAQQPAQFPNQILTSGS